jgi:asparagine synthetase B (glutamine-hydrolysing)
VDLWAWGAGAPGRHARQGPSGLALSGGLDSALVGAALASHAPRHHALSWIAAPGVASEEQASRAEFLARFPQVQWHPVAARLGDPSDGFEGPDPADDPLVTGAPFRPARLALLQRARSLGLNLVLDGEGGDEIFSLGRRIGDFIAAGAWSDLTRVLARSPRRRSLIWRGLVVPRLPSPIGRAWNWREHRRRSPPWLAPAFWRAPATGEALAQSDLRAACASGRAATIDILGHPLTVGSRSDRSLMAARLGLEVCSPLFDRRIVSLALRLPPVLHWEPRGTKPFLRRVASARLPACFADRGKDVGSYRSARHQAITAAGPPAIAATVASCAPLAAQVRMPVVLDWLWRAHGGAVLPERIADALYALVTTARWMNAVARE